MISNVTSSRWFPGGHMNCCKTAVTIACGVALILNACSSNETPVTVATPPAPATSGPVGVSAAGATQRMYLDPVTGLARAPTAAEQATAAKVRAQTRNSDEARSVQTAEEVVLPGGLTEVRVDRRADAQERVCVQTDGSLGRCPPAPGTSDKPGPQ